MIGKARQGLEMGANGGGIVRQQESEIVSRMQTGSGRKIGARAFELFGKLTEHKAIIEGLHPPPHHIQNSLIFFQVGVVNVPLHVGGGRPFRRPAG